MSNKTVFTLIALTLIISACAFGPIAGLSVDQSTNISGTVWLDKNGNGLQDDGELGVEKVTVNLISLTGSLEQEQFTNVGGVYKFNDLDAKRVYSIRVVLSPGYAFTQMDVGDNDFVDSDVHNAGSMIGQTDELENLRTGDNPFVDAGLTGGPAANVVEDVPDVVITGFVWLDVNSNGQYERQVDELLAGIEVHLVEAGVQLVGLDDVIETVKSDSGGLFGFSARAPSGNYRIYIEKPEEYAFTKKDAVADEMLDSDVYDAGIDMGYSDVFDLAQGEPQDLAAGMVYDSFTPEVSEQDVTADFRAVGPLCFEDMLSTLSLPFHVKFEAPNEIILSSPVDGSTARGTIERDGKFHLVDDDGYGTWDGHLNQDWTGTALNGYLENGCETPYDVIFTPVAGD